jgi:hypothetical protein
MRSDVPANCATRRRSREMMPAADAWLDYRRTTSHSALQSASLNASLAVLEDVVQVPTLPYSVPAAGHGGAEAAVQTQGAHPRRTPSGTGTAAVAHPAERAVNNREGGRAQTPSDVTPVTRHTTPHPHTRPRSSGRGGVAD